MKAALALLVLVACDASIPAFGPHAQAMQPAITTDDTARVQAAMTAGTCLPLGDYTVVTPPSPRHDWVLDGGTLCGAGVGQTRIHFTGDGGGKLWVGVVLRSGTTVHDVSLDTLGFVNACAGGKNGRCEQTHLLKEYQGANDVTITDVELNHPIGGDCINVVGMGVGGVVNGQPVGPGGVPYVPNSGLTISHATFTRCARGGVQVSRGLTGLTVADSTFVYTGFDVGSEGAGGYISGVVVQTVSNVLLSHNTFSSPATGGYALQAEWWTGATIDHNASSVRPFITFGSDSLDFSFNDVETAFNAPALNIGDRGWRISSTNDRWTHAGAGAFEAVRVSPLDKNRQADLGDLTIRDSVLSQAAPAAALILRGVTGATLDGVTFVDAGAATMPESFVASWGVAPAVSVLTTGIVETGTVLEGF